MVSHHEILKANRRARQKRFLRRGASIAILVTLVLSFGGWYLWNRPTFALTKILIMGTERVSREQINKVADNVLAGQYWGLWRRRVNWFYPRTALLIALRREFPELATIEAANLSFGTLRINVAERQPAALWCGEKCYFMDNTGLLYASAPEFSNDPFFTLLGPPLP